MGGAAGGARTTSMSASSKTTKGALPPSSKDVRFMPAAHHVARVTPTAVEPVKLTLRTRGCLQSCSPAPAAPPRGTGRTERSPSGTPARTPSSAKARADRGVSSAGFTTAEHPAAKQGPTLRVIIAAGKFQGVMRAQTPTGSLVASSCRPGTVAGITSP